MIEDRKDFAARRVGFRPSDSLRISFASLATLAGIALTGCSRNTPPPAAAELPAAEVAVQIVEARPQPLTEQIIGTVRSKSRVTIEAKISGRIATMPVAVGRHVQAGDPLVQLDARAIHARFNQALATHDQAETEFRRAAALHGQQAATQAEFDAAQSRLRVAEATLDEARTLLGYSHVTAPFAGVVVRRLAEPGDMAAPGKPLLELENPDALRLEANVPESLIDQVKLGDVRTVHIHAPPAQFDAVVAEIAPAADPNSRTFLVKLDLPEASGVRSGQFGRVGIPAGETTTLWAPASALIQHGQMELMFVISENRARLRLVRTGRRNGDEVELLSGVVSGETIVVEHVAALADGQKVQ